MKIIVPVFGATSGIIVQTFSPSGIYTVLEKPIPWVDHQSVIYWPTKWLTETLDKIKAMAEPGDIIASAMWGADLGLMIDDPDYIPPILHYPALADERRYTHVSQNHFGAKTFY